MKTIRTVKFLGVLPALAALLAGCPAMSPSGVSPGGGGAAGVMEGQPAAAGGEKSTSTGSSEGSGGDDDGLPASGAAGGTPAEGPAPQYFASSEASKPHPGGARAPLADVLTEIGGHCDPDCQVGGKFYAICSEPAPPLQVPIRIARYQLEANLYELDDSGEGLATRPLASCAGRVIRLVKGGATSGKFTCEDFPVNAACEFEGTTVLRKVKTTNGYAFESHGYYISAEPMQPNSQPCEPEVFLKSPYIFLKTKWFGLTEVPTDSPPDCAHRALGGN